LPYSKAMVSLQKEYWKCAEFPKRIYRCPTSILLVFVPIRDGRKNGVSALKMNADCSMELLLGR
jgi:hypothetical protein